jgi:hypothetical protein
MAGLAEGNPDKVNASNVFNEVMEDSDGMIPFFIQKYPACLIGA